MNWWTLWRVEKIRSTIWLIGLKGFIQTNVCQNIFVAFRCDFLYNSKIRCSGMPTSHFSRIFITWIDFLHSWLRTLPIWTAKETIIETMPPCFKESYPSTRVIIDATEILTEMPRSLRTQSESYSQYKHHNTAKGLVGVASSGAITFVSNLNAGRCSDKSITNDCEIFKLLERGDSVMADKGFEI